ncbi:hypothetical protein BJP08_03895 [Corynebacterium sp. NML140438]|uniref:DUF4192 domain-containing protein n=1 Tax=Corynebacterium sp. NML140438 TaxID=1906334 RepID=UPI0008FAE6A4|nr:DUF4192 domain-containing protein [Corynebacterium sp. NML140438]OIR42456.1 hypothetical protein BJP08_03895 [Corynebacterium sp. NML140438]
MKINAANSSLFGPSDIIAALPGVLGFYPQESVVVLGILPDSQDAGGLQLGPVVRVDLARLDALVENLKTDTSQYLLGDDVLAYLGIIVSRIPDSDLVIGATERLHYLEEETGFKIDLCWHVSEIAQGTPYTLLFGPSEVPDGEYTLSASLISGSVASVISSPSMRPYVEQGILPELDRGDTFEYFEPIDTESVHVAKEIQEKTRKNGLRLLKDLWESSIQEQGKSSAQLAKHEIENTIDDLLRSPESCLIGQRDVPPPSEMSEPMRNALEGLAALLTHALLRDTLIPAILKHPKRVAGPLLFLARHAEGTVRANALALWAIVAVRCELGSWAGVALQCALQEMPDHSLSDVLLQLLAIGQYEGLLHAVQEGGEAVWMQLELLADC